MSQEDDADTDAIAMKACAESIREKATAYLTEWWGERCPDFDENCPACIRWRALDTLLEQP